MVNMNNKIEALIFQISDPLDYWKEAVQGNVFSVPYFEALKSTDIPKAGKTILESFRKNEGDKEIIKVASLYFGIYETSNNYGLSGKVLYIAGMRKDQPDFTADDIVWKPKWGRFKPRIMQKIAKIEDGYNPEKKINPPITVEKTLNGRIYYCDDFDASNPDLEYFELNPEQKQYLNYNVTLIAAIAIIKCVSAEINFHKPIFVGFDGGDIFRVK